MVSKVVTAKQLDTRLKALTKRVRILEEYEESRSFEEEIEDAEARQKRDRKRQRLNKCKRVGIILLSIASLGILPGVYVIGSLLYNYYHDGELYL